MTLHEEGYRIDDLDRRIIYALMQDGRATATSIAETANVSGATVRNRIEKLEDRGIITGYRAHVDFEAAGGKLRNLYLCNVPVPEREALAHEARAIPEVINVRSLMTGRRNLHVLAVGESTRDLQRVSRSLSKLGIEVENEDLLEDELFNPYEPFNPDDSSLSQRPSRSTTAGAFSRPTSSRYRIRHRSQPPPISVSGCPRLLNNCWPMRELTLRNSGCRSRHGRSSHTRASTRCSTRLAIMPSTD